MLSSHREKGKLYFNAKAFVSSIENELKDTRQKLQSAQEEIQCFDREIVRTKEEISGSQRDH